MAGKEAVSESIAIRNIVVRDDWVYVKSTGHMHRRYVKGPGWWVFRITQGNPELLAELGGTSKWWKPFDGKVTRSNKDITVFGNWRKAKDGVAQFEVAEKSLKYVPPDPRPLVVRMLKPMSK